MKRIALRFRSVDKENFNALREGNKKIETRAASPRYQSIEVGDMLVIACGGEKLEKMVQKVAHVRSVDELLEQFALADIFPYAKDTAEAKATYDSYPGYREKIATYGLLAFVLG